MVDRKIDNVEKLSTNFQVKRVLAHHLCRLDASLTNYYKLPSCGITLFAHLLAPDLY